MSRKITEGHAKRETVILLDVTGTTQASALGVGVLFPQRPEPSAARVGFGAKPQGFALPAP